MVNGKMVNGWEPALGVVMDRAIVRNYSFHSPFTIYNSPAGVR